MFRTVLALSATTALLAACVTDPPQGGTPAADQCGAAALQGLVGRSASTLDTVRLAGPVRVIRPGMAVTMDFIAERLNIDIDAREIITRVYCG